jgi:ribosomal subunit interface protein
MDFQFYFKKMTSSDSLKNMAIKKISDKIHKFADFSSKVHVTFFMNGTQKHVHCGVSAADGTTLFAEGHSENIFNAIDIIAQRLEAQFQRRKTKQKNRQKRRQLEFFSTPVITGQRPRLADEFNEPIDAADIIKLEAALKPIRARMMH